MKPITILGLAMLAAAGPLSAQTLEPQPYAMRGVRLGMTLAEFMAFRIPSENGDPAVFSCTNMPKPNMHMKQEAYSDTAMGIVTCEWFSLMRDNPQSAWYNHGVILGDASGFPSFSFVKYDSAYRLFRIRVVGDNSKFPQYSQLLSAFSAAHGPPTTKTLTVQNGLGAVFPSTSAAWSNGVSSITLVERGDRIDEYRLTYWHDALGQIYDAMLQQHAAEAAKKL